MSREKKNRLFLVLRSGGSYTFKDADLLTFQIRQHYRGEQELEIFCLYDKVDDAWRLANCMLLPMLHKEWGGWWSKMNLFSPELQPYRPFLYIDLDTVVVGDISSLFYPAGGATFVGLADFFAPSYMASGVMWIPDNQQINDVWNLWITSPTEFMSHFKGDQNFLRKCIHEKLFWQDITPAICSFKVQGKNRKWLRQIPDDVFVVCFHGYPKIVEACSVPWVERYFRFEQYIPEGKPRVTVIIPYKIDRGWLQEAIHSIPSWVQLIVSQGEGGWAENFNKAISQIKGDYVRFLHEDDVLPEESIEQSVCAMERQGVDFIHGNAYTISEVGEIIDEYIPPQEISYELMLERNPLHGGTLVYRKSVFDRLGGYDEELNHAEEYDFNLRCFQAGFRLGYCDNYLYSSRSHNKQKSKSYDGNLDDYGKFVVERHKKKFGLMQHNQSEIIM